MDNRQKDRIYRKDVIIGGALPCNVDRNHLITGREEGRVIRSKAHSFAWRTGEGVGGYKAATITVGFLPITD
jgi:hypothetical protein